MPAPDNHPGPQMEPEGPRLEREFPRQPPAVERFETPLRPEPPPARPPQGPPPRPAAAARPAPQPRRWIALALLLVSALVMAGGRDVPRSIYPPPGAVPQAIPGEIVVDLRDDVSDQEIQRLNRQYGIDLQYNSPYSSDWKLMVAKVPPQRTASVIDGLRREPSVEVVEPQIEKRLEAWVPNDPGYPSQWHLKMIGLEDAWEVTRGAGAVVGVVDSGVGAEVNGRLVPFHDFSVTKFAGGYDFGDKDSIPEDHVGHGSHVAGTIAESTNNANMGAGVAPEATIIPVCIVDRQGKLKSSDIADGIKYATDRGANVINLSLGGSYSQVEEKACQYAYGKGVTLVCAAGNDGKAVENYPASLKECISVAAVGPNADRAPYSNMSKAVAVAAPGGDMSRGDRAGIWQNTAQRKRKSGPFQFTPNPAVDGFYPLQGTSMAAPHISGVAALLVSQGVKDPAQIRSILRNTAAAKGPPEQYGAGVVDAARAVRSVRKSGQGGGITVWVVGAAAAFLLLNAARSGKPKTASGSARKGPVQPFRAIPLLISLAAGWSVPPVLEVVFGFGSLLNLAGHSVALGAVWLMTPAMSPRTIWRACAFTAGTMLHLALDLRSGITPFQVTPQARITFWLGANLAVGAFYVYSALVQPKPVAKSAR